MAITLNGTTGITTPGLESTNPIQYSLSQESAKEYNWNGSSSNTSLDFTNIPSWVRRIVVMFASISTNGTTNIQVQLGTGSTPTYTTSGYLGTVISTTGATTVAFTAGFLPSASITAGGVWQGQMIINNLTSNTWNESSTFGRSDSAAGAWGAGSVALSGALTAVRITTVSGTDFFDNGTVNIMYE